MIEPMKKVSLVILNKDKEQSLIDLRKLGLVHLEKLEGNSEKLLQLKEYTANAVLAESILNDLKIMKNKKKAKKLQQPLSDDKVIDLIKEIVSKNDRKKQLMEEINADVNELERFTFWGTVNLEDLEYLHSHNVQIRLYEIVAEKFAEIDESIETVVFSNDKKTIRFLIINGGEGRPEKLLPQAFEVPLPRMTTTLIEEEISKDKEEIAAIEAFYEANAKYSYAIKNFRINLGADIEFENINAGMNHEAEKEETDLAWISGYVPADNMPEFEAACKEHQWAYIADDPEEDDIEVPTKLKNNKLVSLVYPLTDFLGTVPGYHEFDISGWFLLFFTVFFGMIFGDGGYGALVTVGAVLLMLKSAAGKKKVSPLMFFVLLMGIATMVWGAVTCTWFGLDTKYIPDFLQKLSIPMISNAYSNDIWVPFWKPDSGLGLTKDQNLQIFCFMLGLIQLSIAHVKTMGRNFSNKRILKGIGELGSLMQLIGMYWVVLSLVVSSQIFSLSEVIYGIPVGKIAIYLVLVGFILSFVFSNYEGNILASIMASVKNIISVLLGVVNVFSDIVSYIRLWAVGLAGAAISSTVNTLAGGFLGHLTMFLAVIALLVFGHGLNMILNLLSVIVHGVRLNTLEFSNHLGMTWSGLKYDPFKEKQKV